MKKPELEKAPLYNQVIILISKGVGDFQAKKKKIGSELTPFPIPAWTQLRMPWNPGGPLGPPECPRGALIREDMDVRCCIPVHRYVAISLYQLTSAERTVAQLFSMNRPLVNVIFREFCNIVVNVPEAQAVQLPSRNNVKDHVQPSEATTRF